MLKSISLVLSILLLLLSTLAALNYRTKYLESSNALLKISDQLSVENRRSMQFQKDLAALKYSLFDAKIKFKHLLEYNKRLVSSLPPGRWGCDDEANEFIYYGVVKNPTLQKMVSNFSIDNPGRPYIRLLGRSQNTVRIEVVNSEVATQTWGSTGAKCYFGSIVNSITSLDDVDSVSLEFEEGSHFSPGNYGHVY